MRINKHSNLYESTSYNILHIYQQKHHIKKIYCVTQSKYTVLSLIIGVLVYLELSDTNAKVSKCKLISYSLTIWKN